MAIVRIDDMPVSGAPLSTRGLPGRCAEIAGPCVVLIHGYRYDPRIPAADPHRSLYGDATRPWGWPGPLGFTPDGAEGLCVGFGWAAGPAILRRGVWELSEAYLEAGAAGARLGRLVVALSQRAGRPVDLMGHSLGARVALAAMAETARLGAASALGRAILLGPAVYAQDARAAYDACGAHPPETYSFLSERNALFDRAFEAMAARRRGAALGRSGLGRRRAGWIDLEFDHAALPGALKALTKLAPAGRGPCHWSFYTRPGAMALHRAILNRAPGSAVADLRRAGAPERALRAERRRLWRIGAPSLSPRGCENAA